jgi:hypothetical protein
MLFFKARFLPLIRSGRKRQTIRLWRHARVRQGQRAYVPGLGHVKITQVHVLGSLRALTRADALADGFDSRREMLAEIRRLYPSPAQAVRVFRVRFRWLDDPAGGGHDARAVRAGRRRGKPRGANPVFRSAAAPRNDPPAASRRELLRQFVVRLGKQVKLMA